MTIKDNFGHVYTYDAEGRAATVDGEPCFLRRAEEIEREQTNHVQSSLAGLGFLTWLNNPIGQRIHADKNKFYASVKGYDCLITVEFQDPR